TRGIISHHAGKALETIGLRQGQFLGLNLFELYPPEALAPTRRAVAGESAHAIVEAHGGFRENWHVPIRDAQGAVTEVIGLTLDVSDAKRAEKALTDKLALIERQQQVINALSAPIIEVWDKVLTLPLVGVVDSIRAAASMDDLLTQVSAKGARFAILDL